MRKMGNGHLALHEDERAAFKALLLAFYALHDHLIDEQILDGECIPQRLERINLADSPGVKAQVDGICHNLRERHLSACKPPYPRLSVVPANTD